MYRTGFISLALVLATGIAMPASAHGTHSFLGYYGATAQSSHSSSSDSASRTLSAQGVNGGAATVNGSCVQGAGCSRDWSRTLRNGQSASGSVTAQRGVGVERTGTGFRGRNW